MFSCDGKRRETPTGSKTSPRVVLADGARLPGKCLPAAPAFKETPAPMLEHVREGTDYDQISDFYDEGRAKPTPWLYGWRDALRPYVEELTSPIVDIGSGTGIWSVLLAEWFELDVVGVEPSSGMRSQALRKRSHPHVAYVGADAEHLPLRDGSCAAVWLSTVLHHIPDVQAAVRELRRVLAPGGPVLIRNAFSQRDDEILWVRYFPAARALANERWPTIEATVEAFAAGDFRQQSLARVHEVSAQNFIEYGKTVETRTDSTLAAISDDEFERGLAELKKTAENEVPKPVITGLDLLVLR
jgi:ubiquinone/menaquinone biosynthesis C-methylase UbiE